MQALFAEPTSYELFPESLGVLRTLHGNQIRLGLISNTDVDLTPTLRALGIEKFISVAISVRAWGIEKPDPAAFCSPLMKLGVRAQESVFVEDNPRKMAGVLKGLA